MTDDAGQHSPGPLTVAPAVTSQLAAVLDGLGEVVFQTDADGRWTYLNAAWTRITGFSVQESLGRSFLDFVHPDEREHTVALFMAVVAGGASRCHHQTRYVTRDGGFRWVDLNAQLVLDDSGALMANTGTITDITDRRLAEEALLEHGNLVELGYSVETDDLPVGVLTYSADLRVVRGSPLLRRALGHAVDVGRPLDDLQDVLVQRASGSELGGRWGLVATAQRTRRPQYGDVNIEQADGRRLSFHVSCLPLDDSPDLTDDLLDLPSESRELDGDDEDVAPIPAVALVLQDVTSLRRSEQQQSAVARLGQLGLIGEPIAQLLEEAVTIVAYALELPHCAVLEFLGEEGLLARAAAGFKQGARRIGADGRVSLDLLSTALHGTVPVTTPDLRADADYPAQRWLADQGLVSAAAVPIPGTNGTPFGLLTVFAPEGRVLEGDQLAFLQAVAHVLAAAIARHRAEEATRHQALHDPLTGLANRTLLHDRLEQALRGQRRQGTPVALLLMDLDRFKEINDTLGHDVGDDVLRVVGERLAESTREADTVVRLGGDEFAVVMPAVSGVEDAVAVAHKVRGRLNEVISHKGVPLRVDASVGIVLAPEHGDEPIGLLKRADVAMYRAKHLASGVAVYSRDADQNHPERLAYSAALREAIHGGQLVVHYQPKVDLATGRVSAVEALVRWQHPEKGLVLPDDFIPLAERTGLIKPLTWDVLGQAVAQARRWHESGRPVSVAVNLSARMLHDPELVDCVVEVLDDSAIPRSALTLEVTESAVMASPAGAMAAVTKLRQEGIRLSVDDFGTGYSSLAYLRDLPVHELKIDRSFVRDVTNNRNDASIVRSVIELGHNLGMQVVGEGVESREACVLLRELGCDEGQGFFLGRPVPAIDLTGLGEETVASE